MNNTQLLSEAHAKTNEIKPQSTRTFVDANTGLSLLPHRHKLTKSMSTRTSSFTICGVLVAVASSGFIFTVNAAEITRFTTTEQKLTRVEQRDQSQWRWDDTFWSWVTPLLDVHRFVAFCFTRAGTYISMNTTFLVVCVLYRLKVI